MKYLIRDRGKIRAAHYWTGNDTYCKMASTGGLNKKGYSIFEDDKGLKICSMCKAISLKGDHKVTETTVTITIELTEDELESLAGYMHMTSDDWFNYPFWPAGLTKDRFHKGIEGAVYKLEEAKVWSIRKKDEMADSGQTDNSK